MIVAVLLWRRPVQSPTGRERPQATVQSTNTLTLTANNTPVVTPKAAPLSSVNKSSGVIGTDAERLEKLKEIVESKNVPVDFFGLVIDQDSNPIPGVTIKSGVRHWTMPDPNAEVVGADEIPLEATTLGIPS